MSDSTQRQGSEQGSQGQTATLTKPPPPRVEKLPPFKVLLHNDDHNDAIFVVVTLCDLAAMAPEMAFKVMDEAHRTGVALVTVTHKERAELYVDQFKSKGLIASCEPAV